MRRSIRWWWATLFYGINVLIAVRSLLDNHPSALLSIGTAGFCLWVIDAEDRRATAKKENV